MVLEIYRHEKEGKPIKRLWFNAQAKQIMCGIICGYICRACWNLQNVCQIVCRILSKKWKIVRKNTHTSQKTPEQSRKSISEFHAKTWIEKVCRIYLKGLANMEQTRLPFVLDDKKNTLQESGWGGVGSKCPIKLRKKRQCTIHLTVISDGKKPSRLIIFQG